MDLTNSQYRMIVVSLNLRANDLDRLADKHFDSRSSNFTPDENRQIAIDGHKLRTSAGQHRMLADILCTDDKAGKGAWFDGDFDQ